MKFIHISILSFIFLFVHTLLIAGNEQIQIDSLRTLAKTAKDTSYVNTLIKIANIYQKTNKDSAIFYLNNAEKVAEKIDYTDGLLKIIFLHGNILYFNNYYSQAKKLFTRGLDFSKKKKSKLFEAKFLERLASMHLSTDNPNRALNYYYKSLLIFEELNYSKGIAKIYNILGVYKADTKKFDTAEAYLLKSLEINRQLNDTLSIIENENNLGYLYEQMGNIEKARKAYLELIPVIRASGFTFTLPVIYYNLASINQKQGKTSPAIKLLQKAILLSEQQNDTNLLSSMYGNLGELYMNSGSLDSAKYFLNKSVTYSEVINDFETEVQALTLIARIDSANNDLASVVRSLKLILALKDTISNKKLENSFKEAELEYKNRKSQNKIAMQQEIIRVNKKNKRLFIFLFIISSLMVVLLAWLFVLQKKSISKNRRIHEQEKRVKELKLEKSRNEAKLQKLEKDKIEKELKLKERELVSLAMQMDKNKMEIDFIRQKIKELIDQDNISTADLKKLDKAILQKLKDFNNWDLFYKTFNNVHKDFFKKIKEKHPDLTKSELKHCAYIRINLSSNQISSLLNVTIDAVRKTRYRLRKKLKLNPDDSLEDYLLKF